jgi:hypothetical protein
MPQDNLDQFYGTVCPKCNNEPRAHGQRWGSSCLSASQRWWADYAAQTAREEMGYGPPVVRPAPPASVSALQPHGYCPRCGGSIWVDRGEHQFGCAGCGWDPAHPEQHTPV